MMPPGHGQRPWIAPLANSDSNLERGMRLLRFPFSKQMKTEEANWAPPRLPVSWKLRISRKQKKFLIYCKSFQKNMLLLLWVWLNVLNVGSLCGHAIVEGAGCMRESFSWSWRGRMWDDFDPSLELDKADSQNNTMPICPANNRKMSHRRQAAISFFREPMSQGQTAK